MTLKIWLFFITDKKSSIGYTRKFLQTKFLKSKLKSQARVGLCILRSIGRYKFLINLIKQPEVLELVINLSFDLEFVNYFTELLDTSKDHLFGELTWLS